MKLSKVFPYLAKDKGRLNLPIRVEGFVEQKGQIGIKGIRLDTGEEVTAFLTTQGKSAENTRRRSIEQLRNGLKFGRDKYTLEPGGLVSMKGAFQQGDTYLAPWCDVLAFNKSDSEMYVGNGLTMLSMRQQKYGRTSGTVYLFPVEKQYQLKGNNAGDLAETVASFADSCPRPAFLVRVLDDQGKVMDYGMYSKSWHKTEQRKLSGEEIAGSLKEYSDKLQSKHSGTSSVNILASYRFVVSPIALQGDDKSRSQADHYIRLAEAYTKELENGEVELVAQDAFFKMGGDNNEFVNSIIPTRPDSDGVDPALIGGLEYSDRLNEEANQTQDTTKTMAQTQEAVPDAAPEAATPEAVAPDGFSDLDSMSFANDDDEDSAPAMTAQQAKGEWPQMSAMSRKIQWVDLSKVGFVCKTYEHPRAGQLFVLQKTRGTARIGAEVLSGLKAAGFMPFSQGYAAPISWQRADFLSSLAGAQVVEISPEEMRELGYDIKTEENRDGRDSTSPGAVRTNEVAPPAEPSAGNAPTTPASRQAGDASERYSGASDGIDRREGPGHPSGSSSPRPPELGGQVSGGEHGQASSRGDSSPRDGSDGANGGRSGAEPSERVEQPVESASLRENHAWRFSVAELEKKQGHELSSEQLQLYREEVLAAVRRGHLVPKKAAEFCLPDVDVETYLQRYSDDLASIQDEFPPVEMLKPRERSTDHERVSQYEPEDILKNLGHRRTKKMSDEQWADHIREAKSQLERTLTGEKTAYSNFRELGLDVCSPYDLVMGYGYKTSLSLISANITHYLAQIEALDEELARLLRQDPPSSETPVDGDPISETQTVLPSVPSPPITDKEEVEPESFNPNHFFITDEIERGDSGFSRKKRFQENLAALKVLKGASPSVVSDTDRSTLCRWVGWGGLAPVVADYPSQNEPEWVRDGHDELVSLLSQDELRSAQDSVNNAHYTSPQIIRGVWDTVQRLGFRGGRVLEPGCGIGNFLGLCPKPLVPRCQFTGIEKEIVTGQMASLIYPDADIRVAGFETTQLPNGFFDLVIGNVPFGDFQVYDPEYDRFRLNIHDYFIVKSLDKLKVGGIAALITSSGTMDKISSKARLLMSQRGVLAGALRLPTSAFTAQAGTSVTTDILFFYRSHPSAESKNPEWLETVLEKFQTRADSSLEYELPINAIFCNHPEYVLGQIFSGRFKGRKGLEVSLADGQSLPDALVSSSDVLIQRAESLKDELHRHNVLPVREVQPQEQLVIDDVDDSQKEGGFFTRKEGSELAVYQVALGGGQTVRLDLQGKPLQRMLGLIAVRDAMLEAVAVQKELSDSPANEREVGQKRVRLNQVYDAFVKAHGPVNQPANRRLFYDDPASGRVFALELYNANEKTAEKADIFFKRIITPAKRQRADTPQEALALSLDRTGALDWAYMSEVSGRPSDVLRRELLDAGQVFLNPNNEIYEPAAIYLSGNVREKLEHAQAAAQMDSSYQSNVEALREVQPPDLTPKDIEVRLGAPWVSPNDMADFFREIMEVFVIHRSTVKFHFRELTGEWSFDAPKIYRRTTKATVEFGTERRPFSELLQRALNGRPVTVFDVFEKHGEVIRVLNEKETMLAQEKLASIESKFRSWIWSDQKRADRLIEAYNRRYNCYVPPSYDGSHLTFPGMSRSFKPRAKQADAVWRSIAEDKALFAHEVGTGKTFVQVASAIERKRLGKCNKPLMAIPNHMLEQIEREARQIYPGAKILAIQKTDLGQKKRREFLGRVANNDWDLVICSHSVLGKIGLPPFFERQQLQDELEVFRAELLGIDLDDESSRKRYGTKAIESKIKQLEAKLKRLTDTKKTDGIYIDDLGIDSLYVDESHNFKNLMVDTPNGRDGITGSNRAWNLYMLSRWLFAQHGEASGLFMASGTAITNNVWEIFNLMRYLQPDVLSAMGLSSPSAWSATFLSPKSAWEPSPSGSGWQVKERYALQNIPELIRTLRLAMDVVSADDAGVERPDLERTNVTSEMCDAQKAYMHHLDKRVRRIKGGNIDPSRDNLLKIVSEGRKAALDIRLLLPGAPEFKGDKINRCAENLYTEWEQHKEILGTQLVFCDQGVPKPGNASVYGRLRDKLLEKGIPAEEIAFIHDYNDDARKAELFSRVRSGKVRILIGSSGKMGEGTNVQDRITALHHTDPPWRPDQIEQRNGRGKRFGNINNVVRAYYYTTEGSFDLFMWETMRRKAELFSRVLKGDPNVRTLDFQVDPTYAETAAITSNNTLIRDKLEVDQAIQRFELLQKGHADMVWLAKHRISYSQKELAAYHASLASYASLPTPPGDPQVWTFDMPRYGYLSAYEGDREGLLRQIKKVIETQKISTIEGIACGGIPVKLSRAVDPVENRTVSIWSIVEADQITKSRAADVEELFLDRDGNVTRFQSRIEDLEKKIAENREILDTGFAHDEELRSLYVRRQDILVQIENSRDAPVDDFFESEAVDLLEKYRGHEEADESVFRMSA